MAKLDVSFSFKFSTGKDSILTGKHAILFLCAMACVVYAGFCVASFQSRMSGSNSKIKIYSDHKAACHMESLMVANPVMAIFMGFGILMRYRWLIFFSSMHMLLNVSVLYIKVNKESKYQTPAPISRDLGYLMGCWAFPMMGLCIFACLNGTSGIDSVMKQFRRNWRYQVVSYLILLVSTAYIFALSVHIPCDLFHKGTWCSGTATNDYGFKEESNCQKYMGFGSPFIAIAGIKLFLLLAQLFGTFRKSCTAVGLATMLLTLELMFETVCLVAEVLYGIRNSVDKEWFMNKKFLEWNTDTGLKIVGFYIGGWLAVLLGFACARSLQREALKSQGKKRRDRESSDESDASKGEDPSELALAEMLTPDQEKAIEIIKEEDYVVANVLYSKLPKSDPRADA